MATYSREKNAVFYHIPKACGLYIDSILRDECDFMSYNFLSLARISFYWNYKKGIRQEFYNNLHCFLIDRESMRNCYEFTFVRNPYTRFISAFFYCKANRFDEPDVLKTVQDMIDNINLVSYTTFFHVFKTQFQNIKSDVQKPMDYIGKFETLHQDLRVIFKHLKLDLNYSKVKVNESPIKYGDYKQYYTQEILDFVNEHFDEDFTEYGYEKVFRLEDLP